MCMRGDETIDERLELIDRQRDAVLEQIEYLKQTLDTLNYKHWYYETAKAAGTCSVHDNLTEDDIPESIRRTKERLHCKCE